MSLDWTRVVIIIITVIVIVVIVVIVVILIVIPIILSIIVFITVSSVIIIGICQASIRHAGIDLSCAQTGFPRVSFASTQHSQGLPTPR